MESHLAESSLENGKNKLKTNTIKKILKKII